MTDGPVEHDLELTVSALKEGVLDLGIPGGLVEIRRWEGQLAASGAPALVEIGAALAELRGELESDSPDTATVSALLLDLGYAYEQARGPFPQPRFLPAIEASPEIGPALEPQELPSAHQP